MITRAKCNGARLLVGGIGEAEVCRAATANRVRANLGCLCRLERQGEVMSNSRASQSRAGPVWLRRLKRAVRLGVFGLIVLLAISAALWLYFDIKWGRGLRAEVAALKDEGFPLRLEDITASPVPDDQNAATLYQKVFQVRFARLKMNDVAGFRSIYAPGMAGLSQIELRTLKQYVEAPESVDLAQCRELLRRPEVQAALAIFERASRKAECVFPVRWQDGPDMVVPHLLKAESAVRMVAAWALLLASEKRADEALDWCETGLRMCAHFASEPSHTAQRRSHRMWRVISAALSRIMCDRVVSAGVAGRFDEPLRALDVVHRDSCTATLSQSIAVVGVYYEDLHERPASAYDIVGPLTSMASHAIIGPDFGPSRAAQTAARIYCTRLGRPLHKLDHLRFLRWMHAMVSLSKLPYRETAAAHQSLDEEINAASSLLPWIPTIPDLDFLVSSFMMLSAFNCESYIDLTLRRDVTSAEIGMQRVALALKAHKYQHGSYPPDLDSLQSGLHDPLPKDPFSGHPFGYRRQGEGFTVYSIGPDLVDNGGNQEIMVLKVLERGGDIILTCAE